MIVILNASVEESVVKTKAKKTLQLPDEEFEASNLEASSRDFLEVAIKDYIAAHPVVIQAAAPTPTPTPTPIPTPTPTPPPTNKPMAQTRPLVSTQPPSPTKESIKNTFISCFKGKVMIKVKIGTRGCPLGYTKK